HLRRLEPPVLSCLQRHLGEVLTRSRRVERRARNIAAWIDRDPYPHIDLAVNGLRSTCQYVGQNSLSDRTFHHHTFGGWSPLTCRLSWERCDRGYRLLFFGWQRWPIV